MSNGPTHMGSCPAHLRTGPCDANRCGAQAEWDERQELHALRLAVGGGLGWFEAQILGLAPSDPQRKAYEEAMKLAKRHC